MSKNIQEYVARSVIEHMKYQNEKIKHLQEIIENFLFKCPICNKYTDESSNCRQCFVKACENCMYDVRDLQYNISTITICKNCYMKQND